MIGRDAEIEHVSGLLVSGASRAVVIIGEVGIGKTSVFDGVIDRLRDNEWTVLVTRASELEADLPYVGLGDLLRESRPLMEQLPALIAAPLRAALLTAETCDGVERLAVGRATETILDSIARGARLAVAIDDIQWLDQPSLAALSFAIRRLTDVRVVATRRGEHSPATVLDLDSDAVRTLALNR